MSSLNITETSASGNAITVSHDDGAKVAFSYADGIVEANVIGADGSVVLNGRIEVDATASTTAEPFFEVISLGDTRVVMGLASGGTIEAIATEEGITVNADDEYGDILLDISASHDDLGSAEPVPVIGL